LTAFVKGMQGAKAMREVRALRAETLELNVLSLPAPAKKIIIRLAPWVVPGHVLPFR
jgi:hypothetical protein